MNEISDIKTFGDVRLLILQTVMQIRDGGLSVGQGAAIAANMKELNNNIQCEINATKLAIQAKKEGHEFGRVVSMGRKMIGENADDAA